MFCKNCGNELRENTKFCPACGTPVEEGNNQQVENITNQNMVQQNNNLQQVNNDMQQVNNNYVQGNKTVKLVLTRNKKMVGCAIGIVAILDGNQIAVIKNGESFETDITVGQHKLVLKTVGESSEKILNITPELNKVCVNFRMIFGIIAGKPSIESVTSE